MPNGKNLNICVTLRVVWRHLIRIGGVVRLVGEFFDSSTPSNI
jgi:hypothetical protein